MVGFGTPTKAERLRIIADNLSRVYAPTPTEQVTDLRALIDQLRANSRRRTLNVRQLCAGVAPNDDKEHLIICPVCGQMFDCRDQALVEHHSSGDHGPKLVVRLS